MSLFAESHDQPGGRAVLLSIKPKYADLILSGSKRVELRRNWPSNDVGVIVIYASSPVQRIVGLAFVEKVEECTLEQLWEISKANGGGVTFEELKSYIRGKKTAYGIMLGEIKIARNPIDPKMLFSEFSPPQSFLYLSAVEFLRVVRAFFPTAD